MGFDTRGAPWYLLLAREAGITWHEGGSMVIDAPARVSERITLLGRRESCVYLVDGLTEKALVGGGMSYVVPDVLKQLQEFRVDSGPIGRIVILHTHFDHVGIVPFFSGLLTNARVCVSPAGKRMLERPEVIETILSLNRALVSLHHPGSDEADFGLPFDSIRVDEVLEDGSRIHVGDLTLDVLHVPGHSSCSMALYCGSQRALFPSDAAGIMFGDRVFTSANSNYDLYEKNLCRLAALDVDTICAEHYGSLTGDDARSFLAKSQESARITRRLIEETLSRTGDVGATVREVAGLFTAESKGYFLPQEIMETVIGQMTRFLASHRATTPL